MTDAEWLREFALGYKIGGRLMTRFNAIATRYAAMEAGLEQISEDGKVVNPCACCRDHAHIARRALATNESVSSQRPNETDYGYRKRCEDTLEEKT